MALLLGGILPADATEVASIPEVFHVPGGTIRSESSCDGSAGTGWEIASPSVTISSDLLARPSLLDVCGELIDGPSGDTDCWEGINGTGVIAGAAEVFDLVDVSIKRAGTSSAYREHWLIEGRYVRRSDQSHGQFHMVASSYGASWMCDRYSRYLDGSGVLIGDAG